MYLAERSGRLSRKLVIQFLRICAVSALKCYSSAIFCAKAVTIPRSRSTLVGKPESSMSWHHFLSALSMLGGSFCWSWCASRLLFLPLNRSFNVDAAIPNSSVRTEKGGLYSSLFDSTWCIPSSLSCCYKASGHDFTLTIFGSGFVITTLIFFTGANDD